MIKQNAYPDSTIWKLYLNGRVGGETADYEYSDKNFRIAKLLQDQSEIDAFFWYPIVESEKGYHIVVPYSVDNKTVGAIVRVTKEPRNNIFDPLKMPVLRNLDMVY